MNRDPTVLSPLSTPAAHCEQEGGLRRPSAQTRRVLVLTWVPPYQGNRRHPIGLVYYRLSYPKGALLSRSNTIGLKEIGITVGPVDVESFERLAYYLGFFYINMHRRSSISNSSWFVPDAGDSICGSGPSRARTCLTTCRRL